MADSTSWGFIILSVILLFIIIGLGVWIYYLYKRPASVCVANAALCNSYCLSNCNTICTKTPTGPQATPYNIYAYNSNVGTCVSVNNTMFKGIMGQTGGSLQLETSSNINNSSCQWYFIPASKPGQIIIQNVGSLGYINIAANSTITIQTGVSNATPLYWQINKYNNVNYFVFTSSVNNNCPNNLQYITFQTNGSAIQMACVTPTVTGQNWFTAPVAAQQIG